MSNFELLIETLDEEKLCVMAENLLSFMWDSVSRHFGTFETIPGPSENSYANFFIKNNNAVTSDDICNEFKKFNNKRISDKFENTGIPQSQVVMFFQSSLSGEIKEDKRPLILSKIPIYVSEFANSYNVSIEKPDQGREDSGQGKTPCMFIEDLLSKSDESKRAFFESALEECNNSLGNFEEEVGNSKEKSAEVAIEFLITRVVREPLEYFDLSEDLVQYIAKNYPEALSRIFKNYAPDVVNAIIDIVIYSGLFKLGKDVLRFLKSSPQSAATRAVLISMLGFLARVKLIDDIRSAENCVSEKLKVAFDTDVELQKAVIVYSSHVLLGKDVNREVSVGGERFNPSDDESFELSKERLANVFWDRLIMGGHRILRCDESEVLTMLDKVLVEFPEAIDYYGNEGDFMSDISDATVETYNELSDAVKYYATEGNLFGDISREIDDTWE